MNAREFYNVVLMWVVGVCLILINKLYPVLGMGFGILLMIITIVVWVYTQNHPRFAVFIRDLFCRRMPWALVILFAYFGMIFICYFFGV